MPESLQELIAQWRKEARDIHELGRDNQDLIRCADDLEAALAAVAPGECRCDFRFAGLSTYTRDCPIPEHAAAARQGELHITNSALPAGGETPETQEPPRSRLTLAEKHARRLRQQIADHGCPALMPEIDDDERFWCPDCVDREQIAMLLDELTGLKAGETPLQDGWQPIETAPKDGTRVLVVWPNSAVGESFWNQRDNYWGMSLGIVPRFWQPLPAPPRVASPTQEPR
jgi:hypothetical protein